MEEPDDKLPYPIARDGTGTLFLYYGVNNNDNNNNKKKNAANLVIMCPGFPDDQYSFSSLARQLAMNCDCMVGVMCLPGYENNKEQKGHNNNRQGSPDKLDNNDVDDDDDGYDTHCYSFAEWRSAMREAIKVLRKHSTNKAAKLVGMFHDWGCLLGLQYTNQCIAEEAHEQQTHHHQHQQQQQQASSSLLIPDKIVLLDVLMGPHPKTRLEYYSSKHADTGLLSSVSGTSFLNKLYTAWAIASYQFSSAFCWWLHHYISKWVARIFFTAATPLTQALSIFPVSPPDWDYYLSDIMIRKSPDRIIGMAYPYYYLWKGVLTGHARTVLRFLYLPLDLKRTPILYLYGMDKNFHLHNAHGFECLQRETTSTTTTTTTDKNHRRCNIVGVHNAGHWLHHQQPDVCLKHIRDFLQV